MLLTQMWNLDLLMEIQKNAMETVTLRRQNRCMCYDAWWVIDAPEKKTEDKEQENTNTILWLRKDTCLFWLGCDLVPALPGLMLPAAAVMQIFLLSYLTSRYYAANMESSVDNCHCCQGMIKFILSLITAAIKEIAHQKWKKCHTLPTLTQTVIVVKFVVSVIQWVS